jgi:hypothetical protein
MRDERKKVWTHGFQTRLILRICVYWLIYLITVANFLFVWRLLEEGPGNPLEQYVHFLQDYYPALLLFLLLLPIAAWDAVKLSHRLVGPLVRFHQTLQDLGAGKPVRPIRLREGDHLGDLRDAFNQMLETLQRQGVPVLKPTDPPESSPQRKPA